MYSLRTLNYYGKTMVLRKKLYYCHGKNYGTMEKTHDTILKSIKIGLTMEKTMVTCKKVRYYS